MPPAKEFVVVFGDYDTKDIHTSDPESAFYNGYENMYYNNPLPVYINETARIYMINLSQLPAYGYHAMELSLRPGFQAFLKTNPYTPKRGLHLLGMLQYLR